MQLESGNEEELKNLRNVFVGIIEAWTTATEKSKAETVFSQKSGSKLRDEATRS